MTRPFGLSAVARTPPPPALRSHDGCEPAVCTTPHLAAGAAMCLEDAVALGEELAAAPTIDDALRAFCKRRFDRCKYVVETASQLSDWQLHPGTPGADQQRVTAEAFGRLAGPF